MFNVVLNVLGIYNFITKKKKTIILHIIYYIIHIIMCDLYLHVTSIKCSMLRYMG